MNTKVYLLIFTFIIVFVVGMMFVIYSSDENKNPGNDVSSLKVTVSDDTMKTHSAAMPQNHDLLMQAKLLEDRVKQNPDDLEHLILLGNLYFDLGRFDAAIDPYQKALKLKPDNDNVRVDYAVSLFNTGNGETAIRVLDHVIEHNPKHQTAYYNLGVIHMHMNHKDKAKMYWEHVLHIDPNSELAAKAKISLTRI